MDRHLNDKVFMVTGGAKAIGEAVVNTLLAEGEPVAMIDKGSGYGAGNGETVSVRGCFHSRAI